jgi:hypothetical protein
MWCDLGGVVGHESGKSFFTLMNDTEGCKANVKMIVVFPVICFG